MASGDFLGQFHPYDNEPPAASYATLDLRNAQIVLDFDAAADESAIFSGVLPAHYSGGGIEVDLYWWATSATSGDVKWNVEVERRNTDADSDSFASAQTATSAANATSGIYTKTTIPFTDGGQMDSLGAGEPFRLRVTRDANDAADTMTDDAELFAVVVREA